MSFSSLPVTARRGGKDIKSSNNAMDMESIRARRARLEEIIHSMRLPPLTRESMPHHGSLSFPREQEHLGQSSWLSDPRRRHSSSDPSTPMPTRRPQPLTPDHGLHFAPVVTKPFANPLPSIGQRSYLSTSPIPCKKTPPSSGKRRTEVPVEANNDKRPSTGRRKDDGGSDADDEGEDEDEDEKELREDRPEVLKEIVKGLRSTDASTQKSSTVRARKLLSRITDPPIQGFLDAGILPPLLPIVQQTDNTKLQLEATWALTNLASGTTAHTTAVVDAGSIPILVDLLRSKDPAVQEQAIWALGNIAGDGAKYRDEVLKAGVLSPLCNIVESSEKGKDLQTTMARVLSWVFANFFRTKGVVMKTSDLKSCVAALKHLVTYRDQETNIDALWCLSYVTDLGDEGISEVIRQGLLPPIVTHLGSHEKLLIIPALRTTGNIVSGDDQQTEAALEAGVLPLFKQLLRDERRSIRKEVAWAVSNVTAGNQEQIQKAIEAGVLPELVRLIKEGFLDVQKEATWALSNLTSGGSQSQVEALVSAGGMPALLVAASNMLVVANAGVINVALEGIMNVLRVCENKPAIVRELKESGGREKLEALQGYSYEEVSTKAKDILEQYFKDEDESDAKTKDTNQEGDEPP